MEQNVSYAWNALEIVQRMHYKTHQDSHTAISGGEKRTVDLFPRTSGGTDIKMDVSSHVETVALLSKAKGQ